MSYKQDGEPIEANRGTWEVVVKEYAEEDDSSAGNTSEEEEDEQREREQLFSKGEVPSEYWHIQKLFKYMKTGNQTATMIALCCMKDHDLSDKFNQAAIQDIGGLEVLVNLLECKDLRCKLGALKVLRDISGNMAVRRRIADLGGVTLLVANLCDPARDLQILAAETLANVAKIRKARRTVCLTGGIPKVVDLLDVPERCLQTPWDELNVDEKEFVQIAKGGARALWSLSESRKNKDVMKRAGSVFLLAKLLRSVHLDVVLPTVGTIHNCATEPSYQLAIQTEGMIADIVRHLSTMESQQLRKYCAAAIFQCAADGRTRDLVREAGGLEPLVQMARDKELQRDKDMLAAITGAIWKCALSRENAMQFKEAGAVSALVNLLNIESEDVLTNSVGALSELLKLEENRAELRRCAGITPIIMLLNSTHTPLLENLPCVLREVAMEEDSMHDIESMDGVRLVWSLLKNSSPVVRANAAWALVPLVKHASDSGEMVRSFVGGLELIVGQLRTGEPKVLAAVCAALAVIAQDMENLAIITDHGVIPMFTDLVHTKDEVLREHLAEAIAFSCAWGTNRKDLGRLGAITPLVGYMADSNPRVQRTTALALYHLSDNAFNCITMHESGVVVFLLRAVASTDAALQEAAAGCLSNIRRLALEAETYHLVDKGFKNEDDRSTSDEDSVKCEDVQVAKPKK